MDNFYNTDDARKLGHYFTFTNHQLGARDSTSADCQRTPCKERESTADDSRNSMNTLSIILLFDTNISPRKRDSTTLLLYGRRGPGWSNLRAVYQVLMKEMRS